jgi:hypothetical protein
MRMSWIYNAILSLLVSMSFAAVAEEGTKASIEKKLTAEYALTKTTDDKSDIVTAGSVLVLQKDKVYMAPTDAQANPCQNNYKDGKLSQSGSCKANETFRKIPGFGHVIPGQDKAIVTRAFVTGEKFWLTKIDVHDNGKDKGVMLEFYTDAIKEVRYRGTLFVQFKGGLPSPDDALKQVAEVITVAPSEDAKEEKAKPGGVAGTPGKAEAPAPEAAAAEAPPAAVEAPPPAIEAPPPPPAEPATVALGQTPDQVVAALGQPTKKAKIGTKEIYFYKDLKVTFLNGKVKDIQ